MKISILFLLSLVMPFMTFAQRAPQISFETTIAELGHVREVDGKVTYNFKFINTGNAPLLIDNIKTSCGCTAPEYPKEAIKPRQEGNIKIVFDPANRNGHFDNGITIFHNAEPSITVLRVRGSVVPRPQTVADELPFKLGSLRMRINNFNIADIYHDQKDTVSLEIYNEGTHPVNIINYNTPEYISIVSANSILMPKERTRLVLTFDATKKDELGRGWDHIKMITNDKVMPEKTFNVIYTVKQNFTVMTAEERANAAKAVFVKDTHNFGHVRQGATVSHDFKFKNEGNSPLVFYQIKTGCGCTAFQAEKTSIGPGEESYITASYSASGPLGPDSKDITVWTNDPENPVIILTVIANKVASSAPANR